MEKIDLAQFASEINRKFPVQEGEMNVLYGHIGSGKTAIGTLMALKDLKNGQAVYLNWKLNWNGYDERDSLLYIILGLLGIKKRFYRFPRENLHYLPIDENFLSTFEKLTDCRVYLDEGHIAFDSYEMARMSLQKRKAILHTRHYDRAITVISQRPTAIHATIRGNINRYYKCEKILSFPILLFRRSEIQDTLENDRPNEEEIIQKKWFFGWKSWLDLYDSKYLRQGLKQSQHIYGEGYTLTYRDKWIYLKSSGLQTLKRLKPAFRKNEAKLEEPDKPKLF